VTRATGETVNTWAFVAPTSSNYLFTIASGKVFTITKAELTVTPTSNQSKYLGDVEPVLTFATTGFVYSDNASTALTGALSYDKPNPEVVGFYPIKLDGLNAVNYKLEPGATVNFEIKARPATTLKIKEILGSNYGVEYSISSEENLVVKSGKKFRLTAGGSNTNLLWNLDGINVDSLTSPVTSNGCRMTFVSSIIADVEGVTTSCQAPVSIKVGTTEVFKLNLIPNNR
jgi:hypothetical protein